MTTIGSKVRYGAIALVAVAVVAVGCSGDADPTPAPTPEPTPEPAAAAIEIVGNQFRFDPDEVTITSAGSTTIRLTNPDVVEHDWTVEELDIQVEAQHRSADFACAPGSYPRPAVGERVGERSNGGVGLDAGVAFSRGAENSSHVIVAFDICLGSKIQVTAVGLGFACKRVFQVLLGGTAFQVHSCILSY